MKIVSSFKKLEHTQALDQRIQEKSEHLKRYFEGNLELHWTCFVRDDGGHCVELKLLGPAFEYHASASSDSMYKTLDLAIDKIERQIHKKKEKWKQRINHKHNPSLKDKLLEQSEWDEKYWEEKSHDEFAS